MARLRKMLKINRSEGGKQNLLAERSHKEYTAGRNGEVWRGSQTQRGTESQGNGGNGERDDLRGIPEMGICTGFVAIVDNYPVN
jgi:hypothetical protein